MTSLVELGIAQVAVWWITGAALVAAWWVVFSGQHRNPRYDVDLAWWLWHWFTGGLLDTIRAYPTDDGRLHRAGRRALRAGARTALAGGFVAAIYLRSGAPHGTAVATVLGWGVGLAVALAAATVAIAHVAMRWSMWRHYVQPLHWAIAEEAKWDLDMRWWHVRRYLRVRPGLATHPEGVVIGVGPRFKVGTDAENNVIRIATAKLGLSDVSVGWKREGIHRYVQFMGQDPVPDKVSFLDKKVRKLIEAESTWSKVLLGYTRGDKPVWLDLDKESPHVLMSAGTGGGKSVALAGMTAQLMWHGAEVVVQDIKEISHLWLRDLPGVRYNRDVAEIHRGWCDLGEEINRRKARLREVSAEQVWAGEVPEFPRLVVVYEEMSSTTRRLRTYWSSIKGKGDPNVSPALQAYEEFLNMGRALKMNMLAVAQRASALAVGGGDARENFPCRIVIDRYSQQTWKILNGDVPFVPGTKHPGRAQVVIGSDATATQFLHIEEPDASRWVIDKRGMRPRKQPGDVEVAQVEDMPSPGEMVRDSRATATGPARELVTLWAASRDKGKDGGIVPLTAGALRKERKNHPGEFPAPAVIRSDGIEEFDADHLRRWWRNKVKRGATTIIDVDVVDGVDDLVGGNEDDEVGRVDRSENESSADQDSQVGTLQRALRDRDSVRDRLRARVAGPNEAGCELWTGAVSGDGYGYMKVDGKAQPVHRVAYELEVGPIPEGLTIDHRVGPGEPCTSKLCVRGDHLEPVSRETNSARRWERQRAEQGATQ